MAPRAECATVKLPLDYDAPRGATVDIAVLRVKARKPAQRIGSLFVNPGGPGGSGVFMAAAADSFPPDRDGDFLFRRADRSAAGARVRGPPGPASASAADLAPPTARAPTR